MGRRLLVDAEPEETPMEELVNTTIRDAAWDAMMATPECGTQLPEDVEGPEAQEEARAAALQQVRTMKRERDQVPLFDVEVFERQARQTEIIDPALTRVKAEGLDRLTWRDHVQFGDSQTPASALPAWKLSWQAGWMVGFAPRTPDSPRVSGRVLHTQEQPNNFLLPVMVQVQVLMGEKVVEEVATVPATAIQSILGKNNA